MVANVASCTKLEATDQEFAMPARPDVVRLTRRVLPMAAVLLAAPLAATAPALAQDASDEAARADAVPRIVDRKLGEEEQILRRHEWFFSTRRAGASSAAEMARLRFDAVRETRKALEVQRKRRDDGLDAETNFWVAKGPAPSTFGGWAFGNVSGRIAALEADWDNGILYLGSASGGLWKSTNDGLSWESIFDSSGTLTVGAIEVDPNDSDVIWVGTGENVVGCESYFGVGLLRSSDGGATWEPRNGSDELLADLSMFADIVVDPRDSNHVVTGGRVRGCSGGSSVPGGLYTTEDGGQTWVQRLSGVSVYEIQQDPAVLDVFWAATDQGLYKSTDNAETWVKQTASSLPSSGTGRTELTVAPSDGNVVYALFSTGNSGGSEFWQTTNGGASWTLRATGSDACDGQCWYNSVLRVKIDDPNVVYRGNVHIFKSTNGGVDWVDLSNNWGASQKVHQDTHAFLMDPNDPQTFYVGCDGGIWKSSDGGTNFDNLNGDLNVTQFYAVGVDALDPETICGGSQDNSSLARTTSNVWDLQAVTGDGFVCHFNPVDPSYAYITSYPNGGYPNVLRSTTGVFGSFSTITGAGSGIVGGDRANWVTPYVLDPRSPNVLYLGTQRVYRSDDHGSNWTQVGPDDITDGGGTVVSLEVNRNFNEVVYAGTTDGNVWRSADGGSTWTEITAGLPPRSINDIAADPTNPDRAFATVGGFNTAHLWEWTLEGGWVSRGADLPNVPANSVLMLTDEDLLVGTDTGVFRSKDGGVSVEPYANGLPEGLVVTDLDWNADQSILTAGTYGRGAWQVTVDPVEPIVVYDSVEQPFVEVDGDGDEHVEPGETWSVRPILRNAGGLPAESVQARLSTAAAGVRVVEPDVRSYGTLDPGDAGTPLSAYEFVVEPGFACGETITFDLVDVTTTNEPFEYNDRPGAFSVTVVDSYEESTYDTLLDEDFESGANGWTHEAVDPGIFECFGKVYRDEWNLTSKDATHGTSFHCGKGPTGSYARTDYSWLYAAGKDSAGGAGIVLPGDVTSITLTVEHWYDTVSGQDGGQVVIDATENGDDTFQTLRPEGGYPGALNSGGCNGLRGKQAFQGSSGGWVTSTFDLTPYKGEKVWLAFVFGSDFDPASGEGWYIDDVKIETETLGAPICQVSDWPGRVPATTRFALVGENLIEASWAPSCNEDSVSGQTYSVQAGRLADLRGGTYAHAPVAGRCDRLSPATFTPAAGNEYYLVVPSYDGRQGGAGTRSDGGERPLPDATCGVPREGACP
jgi:hypothetical protein